MSVVTQWEATRYDGLRRTRTGIAQPGRAAASTSRESVVRIHLPVLGAISFALGERLGLPDCPYLVRWSVETKLGALRLHHWLAPDDARAFHDHPWSFFTWVIKGGYTDTSPNRADHLASGSWRFRHAHHRHTVCPDPAGAWTLLVTGPPIRKWGFWVGDRFVKANKYFATYGHHPCRSFA